MQGRDSAPLGRFVFASFAVVPLCLLVVAVSQLYRLGDLERWLPSLVLAGAGAGTTAAIGLLPLKRAGRRRDGR